MLEPPRETLLDVAFEVCILYKEVLEVFLETHEHINQRCPAFTLKGPKPCTQCKKHGTAFFGTIIKRLQLAVQADPLLQKTDIKPIDDGFDPDDLDLQHKRSPTFKELDLRPKNSPSLEEILSVFLGAPKEST